MPPPKVWALRVALISRWALTGRIAPCGLNSTVPGKLPGLPVATAGKADLVGLGRMGIEHAAEKRTGGCAEAVEKPQNRLSNLSDLTQVWDDIYAIECSIRCKGMPNQR